MNQQVAPGAVETKMPRATSTQLGQGLLQGDSAMPAVEQSVEVVHAVGAPPAQNTQPPARGEVEDWFAAQHLAAYGPVAVSLGYEKLVFLRGMDEAEVAGLIQKLQMPTPHARAFRVALARLVPQATAAPGGAPVPGVVASVAVPATPVPVMAQPAQRVVQVVQQPAPVVNQTSSGNSRAKAVSPGSHWRARGSWANDCCDHCACLFGSGWWLQCLRLCLHWVDGVRPVQRRSGLRCLRSVLHHRWWYCHRS